MWGDFRVGCRWFLTKVKYCIFIQLMATDKQKQIFDYIRGHIRRLGYAPSFADIQRHFQFRSPTAVTDHLKALERLGMIARELGLSRAIRIPKEFDFDNIPVYGRIPAGIPDSQIQGDEGTVRVDLASLGISTGSPVFALKVSGDSMIGAGILSGDIVLLEARQALENEIVAALIDNETTLKRLIKRKGKVFLRAENPKYSDLIPEEEMVIQGVMRALIRA